MQAAGEAREGGEKQGQKLDLLSTEATPFKQFCLKPMKRPRSAPSAPQFPKSGGLAFGLCLGPSLRGHAAAGCPRQPLLGHGRPALSTARGAQLHARLLLRALAELRFGPRRGVWSAVE